MAGLVEKIVKRDIRARTPDPLNEELAYAIGIFLAHYLKGQSEKMIIGHDMRLSSPSLAKALAAGIFREGLQVESLGQCSTEMISFVSGDRKVPAVMVTASHNPPEYNGFKILQAGAAPIETSTLKEIVREAEQFPKEMVTSFREVPLLNLDEGYVEKVLSTSGISREGYGQEISVVIEAGNGMGAKVFQKIVPHLAWLKPIYYHGVPDGNFPSGILPNTLDPCYIKRLFWEVTDNRADLGICFDGDADRVAFVYRTIKGEIRILTPSQTGALIIKQILGGKGKKSKIFYNLVTSALIPELVESLGGKARMTPVGQVGIRTRALRSENIDYFFATEHSGHYYYRDFYWADSGMISTLIVMDMFARLAVQGKDFSSTIHPWETRFFQSEEMSFGFPEIELMQKWIDYIRKEMKVEPLHEYGPGDPIDTKKILKAHCFLDGYSGWWWFCLRPSGTESQLRLITEVILNESMPESQRVELGPEILAEKVNQLTNFINKERSWK